MLHVQVLLGIFVREARRTRPPGGGAVQRRSPVRSLLRPRRVRPKGRRRREIPGSPLGARQRTMRLERLLSWRARVAPHDRRERPLEAHRPAAAAVDGAQRGLEGGDLEVMRVRRIVGRRRHIWERLLPQGVGFGHLAHLDGDLDGSDRVAEEHRLLFLRKTPELRAEDSEARDARLPKKALFSQVGRLTGSVPTVRHGGVVSGGGLLVS